MASCAGARPATVDLETAAVPALRRWRRPPSHRYYHRAPESQSSEPRPNGPPQQDRRVARFVATIGRPGLGHRAGCPGMTPAAPGDQSTLPAGPEVAGVPGAADRDSRTPSRAADHLLCEVEQQVNDGAEPALSGPACRPRLVRSTNVTATLPARADPPTGGGSGNVLLILGPVAARAATGCWMAGPRSRGPSAPSPGPIVFLRLRGDRGQPSPWSRRPLASCWSPAPGQFLIGHSCAVLPALVGARVPRPACCSAWPRRNSLPLPSPCAP